MVPWPVGCLYFAFQRNANRPETLPTLGLQGKRRPPKPHSHEVMVVRVPRWTAHVLGFDGFPTRMRCVGVVCLCVWVGGLVSERVGERVVGGWVWWWVGEWGCELPGTGLLV